VTYRQLAELAVGKRAAIVATACLPWAELSGDALQNYI